MPVASPAASRNMVALALELAFKTGFQPIARCALFGVMRRASMQKCARVQLAVTASCLSRTPPRSANRVTNAQPIGQTTWSLPTMVKSLRKARLPGRGRTKVRLRSPAAAEYGQSGCELVSRRCSSIFEPAILINHRAIRKRSPNRGYPVDLPLQFDLLGEPLLSASAVSPARTRKGHVQRSELGSSSLGHTSSCSPDRMRSLNVPTSAGSTVLARTNHSTSSVTRATNASSSRF